MQVQSIDKSVRSESNSFELVDVTSAVSRKAGVQPAFMTALLSGMTENHFQISDKVVYDEIIENQQLVSGKRFDEVGGGKVTLDSGKEKMFRTGSFGISGKVSVADVYGKRKFGEEGAYSIEDRVAELTVKMQRGWNLFEEMSYAQLLTADTNYTAGGAAKSYNFHTDIVGSSRAVATDLLLGSAADDVVNKINAKVDALQENASKAGISYQAVFMVCGGTLFDKLFDLEQTVAAGVFALNPATPLDLTAYGVSRSNFEGQSLSFMRRHFTSALTGVTYVRVPDSVTGTPFLPTDNGIMIPVGATNMFARIYSTILHKDYYDMVAMPKYGFMKEHDREGVTLYEEQNVLYMNKYPELIQHFTSSD